MPQLQELPDGDTWVVERPFWYKWDNGTLFVPPSGIGSLAMMLSNPVWTTDCGSIPQIFQNIFKRDGRYLPAYVAHDWLYQSEKYDRATCDSLLHQMLTELGANWLARNIIYSSVRIGGSFVWRKHDKKAIEDMRAYEAAALFIFN